MKKIPKFLCASLLLFSAGVVQAAWPHKPITLVVPFPPGGGTDVIGRIIAKELGQRLGVAVVVENRAGVSGNLGSRHVAKSLPDGYTLLIGTTAQSISSALYRHAGYDLATDLETISTINDGPLVLISRPGLRVDSIKELIELARRSPGKITYATPGYGTSAHMAAEALSLAAGIRMLHVPYQGSAPVLTDLMSGQVDITFDLLVTAKPYLATGKVWRVGVATRERSPLVPDWPTLSEQSPGQLKDFNETAWNVLMAPRGTPSDVLKKLNAVMKDILSDEKVKNKFMEFGNLPLWKTPEDSKAFLINDINKWKKVIHDARIDKI